MQQVSYYQDLLRLDIEIVEQNSSATINLQILVQVCYACQHYLCCADQIDFVPVLFDCSIGTTTTWSPPTAPSEASIVTAEDKTFPQNRVIHHRTQSNQITFYYRSQSMPNYKLLSANKHFSLFLPVSVSLCLSLSLSFVHSITVPFNLHCKHL